MILKISNEMKTQSKAKIFLLIIGILLIANIVLLAFLIKEKQSHKDRRTITAEFLQNEIGFDAAQMQQYDSLANIHHEKMKASMDELRNDKQQELKQLADAGFGDSAVQAIALQSVEKQQKFELQMLEFVKDIRQVCTPGQQAKFDTSFYKTLGRKK
jgi:hypothetical protein